MPRRASRPRAPSEAQSCEASGRGRGAREATRGAVDQAMTSPGDASASGDVADSGREIAPDEHAVAGTASVDRDPSSSVFSARRSNVASAASADDFFARNESDENESDGESDGVWVGARGGTGDGWTGDRWR